MNFYELLKRGKVNESDIDIFIGKWHNETSNCGQLHDYLGLTWEQYRTWVKTGEID